MAYAFKVTAKQNVGGSKGIAKGLSVQISKTGGNPNINDILAAKTPSHKISELPGRFRASDFRKLRRERCGHRDRRDLAKSAG